MRWSTGIVLLVDRASEALEVLRTALHSTDFVLLQATTGDEAIGVLSRLQFPVDLAIIDLELPNDDGVVISLLTMLARRKITKIIVKTSRQDKPFLEQVNCFGIDAIVLKPISAEQFVETVQAALTRCRMDSAGSSTGTAA